MKNLIMIFCLCAFSLSTFAQKEYENDEHRRDSYKKRHETLFNKAKVIGVFVSPIFEYGNFEDDFTMSGGGGVGLIIDNFFIGAYGLGSVDNSFVENEWESFEIGHGGLWVGYTLNHFKMLHLYSSVKVGWGALDIEFEDNFDYSDAIFAATPEIGVELNIFRFFKVAVAGGYRYVDGVNPDLSGYKKGDFNSFVGTLTLRFGAFGNYRKWD